jgi:hypothetical protein
LLLIREEACINVVMFVREVEEVGILMLRPDDGPCTGATVVRIIPDHGHHVEFADDRRRPEL